MSSIRAYVTLTRPANIVTAWADILAGVVIAGAYPLSSSHEHMFSVLWLLLSTTGLYGGGVILNDFFDAKIDAIERPERPIPSGKISKRTAGIYGAMTLAVGVFSAFMASLHSGMIAITIVVFILVYDSWAKHKGVLGPFFMGLCRAGNLILGISILTEAVVPNAWMGLFPLVFVMSITLTSQQENAGKNRHSIKVSITFDLLVLAGLVVLAWLKQTLAWWAVPFFLLWYLPNLSTKIKALQKNEPHLVKLAVKTSVLSLIPLNACYAAGSGIWIVALIILSLLPLSILLAKKFAVT